MQTPYLGTQSLDLVAHYQASQSSNQVAFYQASRSLNQVARYQASRICETAVMLIFRCFVYTSFGLLIMSGNDMQNGTGKVHYYKIKLVT